MQSTNIHGLLEVISAEYSRRYSGFSIGASEFNRARAPFPGTTALAFHQ
jgi:hypothetical protein